MTAPRNLARAMEDLRERLWFIPVTMAVAAALAAELLVRLDRALGEDGRPGWVFGGDAEAAREMLSTVATASLTVLGVTLSITLAVLALTGQGYSPRTIRRFTRDRLVQAVIGGFVGTFVFALVALRLVRTDQVPGITVTVAVLLAIAALGLLIAFFHHMATEIRVERLIDAVWGETREAVARLPAARGHDDRDLAPPAMTVRAAVSGRVRAIDDAALAAVARRTGGTVVVVPAPGGFVAEGEALARIHGGAPDDAAADAVRAAVVLGIERAIEGDPAFGIDQLTDIALRALSPGINDPSTAEEALLRSADLLRRLADRELGTTVAEEGRTLVVRELPTWDDLVGGAFDQAAAVAEAQGDAATMRVLVDALGRVLAATDDPVRVEALRARARRVRDGARRGVAEPTERRRVEDAAAALA